MAVRLLEFGQSLESFAFDERIPLGFSDDSVIQVVDLSQQYFLRSSIFPYPIHLILFFEYLLKRN